MISRGTERLKEASAIKWVKSHLIFSYLFATYISN